MSVTYLLEFMRAEKGFGEIFSSMGRFTDGIGMLLMPDCCSLFFSWMLFCKSGL
jgi:hypothetical protein